MPTMPNVVGMGISQATTTLIQAGITPDNGLLPSAGFVNIGYFDKWPIALNWIKSTAPSGQVTAQSPAAGTTNVAFNATVTLTVSNFPMAVSNLYSAGGYS